MLRMIDRPWQRPGDDPEKDADWYEPLPEEIVLAPDYMAELPLWGEGFGNIDWHFTKFSPELLDRLADWQQEFDDNFHPWGTGWRSASARGLWTAQAEELAAEVRAALGARARLIVDLWPLDDKDQDA